MSCISTEELFGCYTAADGTKQTVVVHNVSDADGVVISTLYLGVDHAPVADATADNVTLGACPVSPPNTTMEMFCETVDGEQVYLWCFTTISYDELGAPVLPPVVNYLTLDKTAVYEPVGTPEKCKDCLPVADAGVLTSWDDLRAAVNA